MALTPICSIDASGIAVPTLGQCLAYFATAYKNIYGSDTVIEASSQDGEMLGLLATALNDTNGAALAAYLAYSPATGQGSGLSSTVKINGLARKVASYSSVPVLIVGVASTTISNGLLSDGANVWALPASFTIPLEGQLTVTATCQTVGAITLATGYQFTISTQTLGWQSATTTANATAGAPVELDSALRQRQSRSTMLPSSTMLEGIEGAVLAVPGVARLRVYENDTSAPDANGIPGHSVAIVSDGGDAQTIANEIALMKFAAGTYGTTTEYVVDAYGVNHPINFFYVTEPEVTWAVTLAPGPQFSINTNLLIQQSLAAWTTGLGIGNGIQLSRAYAAAYLTPSIQAASAALSAALASGDTVAAQTQLALITSLNATAQTYEVIGLTVARDGGPLTAADVVIAFNEAPLTVASDVSVTP